MISEDVDCPESCDDEQNVIQTPDAETCKADNELAKLFRTKFNIAAQECVSLQKSYILHLDANKSWDTIAAGTSERGVHLFRMTESGLLQRQTFDAKLRNLPTTAAVCGVRFANTDANLLYVGTTDGTIYAYDMRTSQTVTEFREDEASAAGGRKTLTCFDVNANDRVLCAGTEQSGTDTYLLFFDTRKQSTMGGYWESHSEDITQVRFHPTKADTLASGSTDGLINVYDISQPCEDDALDKILNTESSVQRLQWHTTTATTSGSDSAAAANNANNNGSSQTERDLISCITHVNDLQLYDVDESDMVFANDRNALAARIGRQASLEDNSWIGCHSTQDSGQLLVLTGAFAEEGESLRSLTLDTTKRPKKMALKPAGDFAHTKRQTVRCSLYNGNTNMLATGGETGMLTLWSSDSDTNRSSELKEKTKDRNRKHKAKPY